MLYRSKQETICATRFFRLWGTRALASRLRHFGSCRMSQLRCSGRVSVLSPTDQLLQWTAVGSQWNSRLKDCGTSPVGFAGSRSNPDFRADFVAAMMPVHGKIGSGLGDPSCLAGLLAGLAGFTTSSADAVPSMTLLMPSWSTWRMEMMCKTKARAANDGYRFFQVAALAVWCLEFGTWYLASGVWCLLVTNR